MYRLCLIVLMLASCAYSNDSHWEIAEEDQNTGNLTMVYEMELYQAPNQHSDLGYKLASKQCTNWGYADAQLTDEQNMECQERNDEGNCLAWRMTRGYTCLSEGETETSALADEELADLDEN